MNHRADVLIVTVTRVESLAVLEAFKEQTARDAGIQSIGDKTYHDLGTVNGATVWMVRSEMGAGGLGGAQQTVTKAVAALSPAAVIMVGIAFGIDEQQQQIGDILVSENLRPYELRRVGTHEGQPRIILRTDRPHGSAWLLDAFKNADLHWKGARVRFGCVLTGEKLVDNLDFREQLRAFEPEAIGGEMEGAGLYVACQDAKVDWLLVKAICDWADGQKEQDREPRQSTAARNATAFVVHVLRSVGLKREAAPSCGSIPNQRPRTTSVGSEGSVTAQDDRSLAAQTIRGSAPVTEDGNTVVQQSGSGGVAIGEGAVAAGAGGVAVDGSVQGDIVLGGGKPRRPETKPKPTVPPAWLLD